MPSNISVSPTYFPVFGSYVYLIPLVTTGTGFQSPVELSYTSASPSCSPVVSVSVSPLSVVEPPPPADKSPGSHA